MDRVAVVAFGVLLLLVCLFWTYGYIRRRSKERFQGGSRAGAVTTVDRRD